MATDNQEHKCAKCGKIIKSGAEFVHQGAVYCCSNCCKTTTENSNMCEFC